MSFTGMVTDATKFSSEVEVSGCVGASPEGRQDVARVENAGPEVEEKAGLARKHWPLLQSLPRHKLKFYLHFI
jgi:hypothetical protein